MKKQNTLEHDLVEILSRYCGERGDNEGAVDTLARIIDERNLLLRVIEKEIFNRK